MKFRLKPQEVDAVRLSNCKFQECAEFLGETVWEMGRDDSGQFYINYGKLSAVQGEWLVRDSKGVVKVMTNDAFDEWYDEVCEVPEP